MKLNEIQWNSIQTNEIQCKPLKFNENRCKPMKIFDKQWGSVQIQWTSVKNNGKSMKSIENQWTSNDNQWKSMKKKWTSMQNNDKPHQTSPGVSRTRTWGTREAPQSRRTTFRSISGNMIFWQEGGHGHTDWGQIPVCKPGDGRHNVSRAHAASPRPHVRTKRIRFPG